MPFPTPQTPCTNAQHTSATADVAQTNTDDGREQEKGRRQGGEQEQERGGWDEGIAAGSGFSKPKHRPKPSSSHDLGLGWAQPIWAWLGPAQGLKLGHAHHYPSPMDTMSRSGSLPICVSSGTSGWGVWPRADHSYSAQHLLSLDVRLLELAITSVPTQLSFALPELLPESPPLPAVTNDSVYALSHLVRSGDWDAFIMLLRFCAIVQAHASSIIHLGISCSSNTPYLSLSLSSLPPHQAALCMLTEVSPAALPMSPVTTSTPSAVAAPAQSDEAVLLAACKADIAVLNCATSLHDVIAQIEAGDVACIRQLYGPCTGCAAISLWQSIKYTVCHREWLYLQLQDEFCGDKNHFFEFFTIQTTPEVNGKSLKRKAKHNASVEHLQPLWKFDEAISQRDKNLAELMVSNEYSDEGRFCSEKWEAKWLGMNWWEI
ncbi:uncharacterized protein F5147DRAFT_766670 [Suillus discolor]|uniref:Uncharacterized protein n=1 Tax=Suillus discolor TaxID=1912936 RepID=A0A9P7FLR4_9AGAM|nr:uncharacterized protein F5147DRAFT_766670 [Suillus discolor]KAG2120777.1 hypothetical protein F5147DRAFT_766670 [Suillus discolor]